MGHLRCYVVNGETSDRSRESLNRKDSNSRSKFRLEGKTNPGYNDDVDDGILIKAADSDPGKHISYSFSFGVYY